tara:strand:+ start:59 stop:817 length:759 start_codon:yes stop_codon:yes gene_type:complete
MAVTVLSGTSGALYYKPAGTTGTFGTGDVTIGTETMVVQAYLNLKVGDPVKFQVVDSSTGGSGTGTLPAGLTAGTTYYIKTYTASTGAMTVSATNGGSAVNLTDVGTAAAPNEFEVYYNDYASVGQVQSWSFEVTRSEIDVTTIGQTVGQYAPFKTYISGFADGSGSASVYVTDEDAALSNRLVEDVLQRQQVGAAFRLYQDKQGTEALSRSISMDAVLLSASFTVNPDDAQMVEVAFRPNNAPTFDLSTSS